MKTLGQTFQKTITISDVQQASFDQIEEMTGIKFAEYEKQVRYMEQYAVQILDVTRQAAAASSTAWSAMNR